MTVSLIGSSNAMMDVLKMVEKLGPSDATVLIEGESGTGKELVARALHERSNRAEGVFLSLNCGAIPPNLLESTLFGHVKGAFTGAVGNAPGLFRSAEHGTLFLDEVGVMPPETQIRMLRVLQEREVFPVGSTDAVKVNCRLLAATNSPLLDKVNAGTFRADLYYRLNVVRMEIPPLRYRGDDVVELALHFLRKADSTRRKRVCAAVITRLKKYEWPGNVRQLEHAIAHAVLVDEDDLITEVDLPEEVLRARPHGQALFVNPPTWPLAQVINTYVGQVLEYTGHNKKRTCDILGINTSTLYRWLVGETAPTSINWVRPGSRRIRRPPDKSVLVAVVKPSE